MALKKNSTLDGKIKELWGMDDDLSMMTRPSLEQKPKQAK